MSLHLQPSVLRNLLTNAVLKCAREAKLPIPEPGETSKGLHAAIKWNVGLIEEHYGLAAIDTAYRLGGNAAVDVQVAAFYEDTAAKLVPPE